MDRVAIHATQVEGHQTCPRKWYLLSYLKKEPRSPEAALQLGRLIHAAFDLHYYKGVDLSDAWISLVRREFEDLKKASADGTLWEEEETKLFDQASVGYSMLRNYVEWQQKPGEWADYNLQFLDTELEFDVHLDGFQFAGRWDGLVRRRDTGQVFVLENKTCQSLERTKAGIYYDFQPLMYLWAAQQLHTDVVGVLYTFLRKMNVNIPILQNGLPSKAVRSSGKTAVTCTVDQYTAAIESCLEGATPERKAQVWADYQDPIEYLQFNAPPVVERYPFLPPPAMVAAACRTVREEADAMQITVDNMELGVVPTPHKNRFKCPYCVARQVCYLMDLGGDWQAQLDQDFVAARYHERTEDSD